MKIRVGDRFINNKFTEYEVIEIVLKDHDSPRYDNMEMYDSEKIYKADRIELYYRYYRDGKPLTTEPIDDDSSIQDLLTAINKSTLKHVPLAKRMLRERLLKG